MGSAQVPTGEIIRCQTPFTHCRFSPTEMLQNPPYVQNWFGVLQVEPMAGDRGGQPAPPVFQSRHVQALPVMPAPLEQGRQPQRPCT